MTDDPNLATVDLGRVHRMLLDQLEPGDEEAVATIDRPDAIYPRGQRVQRRLFKQARRVYLARGFGMAVDILRNPEAANALGTETAERSSD